MRKLLMGGMKMEKIKKWKGTIGGYGRTTLYGLFENEKLICVYQPKGVNTELREADEWIDTKNVPEYVKEYFRKTKIFYTDQSN